MRRQIVVDPGDGTKTAGILAECQALRGHVDQLIAAVVRSKSQVSGAVVAYRRIEARNDQHNDPGEQASDDPGERAIDRSPGARAACTVGSASRVNQKLAGLAALHRSGSLNDEEFMLAKRRL